MDRLVDSKLDDATLAVELMGNYLRTVVQPQNDRLELAMQEYGLFLAGRLLTIAA